MLRLAGASGDRGWAWSKDLDAAGQPIQLVPPVGVHWTLLASHERTLLISYVDPHCTVEVTEARMCIACGHTALYLELGLDPPAY